MKKLILVLALVGLLLVPVACAKAPTPSPGPVPAPAPMPTPYPAPKITIAPEPAPPGRGVIVDQAGGMVMPSVAQDRLIVRTGDMLLEVNDVVKARDEVAGVAERLEGYVVSSQIFGEGEERRGWISIRVPNERFETALAEMRKLATRVKSESTSSQDVTEEYVDLQARLKNAEATEAQYLAILGKAEKVEELLMIYDALSRVRAEIEQIKGRMQYLERTTALSQITVSLEPVTTARPLGGWSATETFKSAVRGITVLGQWLVTVAIWVGIFVPIWGSLLGFILWRLRRRKAAAL
ncbi:MAG: DUF4349 domain-containing protein [Chloroflexi bacterium]|nr:DUF4349 domain-containing protein [Chloroflexota bacterium]